MVQSGAIDEHFVWNEFFPTVPNYWLRAEPIVNEWRAEVGRLLYFEDAKHLSETLISYEEKQLARIKSQNEARPSNEKVRHFLQEESKEEN